MLFVFSDSICFNFFAPLIICKSCVISDDEEGEDGEEGNLLQDLYNKNYFFNHLNCHCLSQKDQMQ